MPTPTVLQSTCPAISLTDRGRIRAVLASLEQRWDGLNAQQRRHALELVADLAACYRQRDVCALKLA